MANPTAYRKGKLTSLPEMQPPEVAFKEDIPFEQYSGHQHLLDTWYSPNGHRPLNTSGSTCFPSSLQSDSAAFLPLSSPSISLSSTPSASIWPCGYENEGMPAQLHINQLFAPNIFPSTIPNPAPPRSNIGNSVDVNPFDLLNTTVLPLPPFQNPSSYLSSLSRNTSLTSPSVPPASIHPFESDLSPPLLFEENKMMKAAVFDFSENSLQNKAPFPIPTDPTTLTSMTSSPQSPSRSLHCNTMSNPPSSPGAPPVKRRRGRPRMHQPSVALTDHQPGPDTARYDGFFSNISAKTTSPNISPLTRRKPHNMVERKYRQGLNKEMDRLRNVLPQLAGHKRPRYAFLQKHSSSSCASGGEVEGGYSGGGVAEDGDHAEEECADDDVDDDDADDGEDGENVGTTNVHRASKAMVLQRAVEEIESLRLEKRRLEEAVKSLEDLVDIMGRGIKREDADIIRNRTKCGE